MPEPCGRRVRIELGGVLIADSTAALRVLETSHPANLYGGWVTASLRGPFKGGPGTTGW